MNNNINGFILLIAVIKRLEVLTPNYEYKRSVTDFSGHLYNTIKTKLKLSDNDMFRQKTFENYFSTHFLKGDFSPLCNPSQKAKIPNILTHFLYDDKKKSLRFFLKNIPNISIEEGIIYLEKISEHFDKAKIIEELNSIAPQSQEAAALITDTLFNKTIPKWLEGTTWLRYKRHDRGISISEIHIGEKNSEGYHEATMKEQYEAEANYKGIVGTLPDSSFLLFKFHCPELPTSYSQVIAYMGKSSSSLCIGHESYISYQHRKLLTKSVILKKATETGGFGYIQYKTDEYYQLDKEIVRYLRKKEQNRLSTPDKTITSIENLREWFSEMDNRKNNNGCKGYIGQQYYLYFSYLDTDSRKWLIREDELEIQEREDKTISATFWHSLDGINKEEWEGDCYIKEHFLICILFKKNMAITNPDPVFLMMNTTSGQAQTTFECFTGVISGIRDTGNNVVSYLSLLVKRNIFGFMGLKDNRVKDFFTHAETEKRILPPSLQEFRLSELTKKRKKI